MIRHVESHQTPEKDKHHTYWRLHLLMLLNTIKKGFSQQNINTNNKSIVGQIVKSAYKRVVCLAWVRDCENSTTL